ncbi:MAG TPA: NAD(P)/FAD-dependent oxidoreductase [Candidatus Syntrophoarchaeum butanivorans]|uniref:NAD(P)/FAD-dependent oxidoreductase n=1 Tax=Candidatus Syntropharchaeum butanivorans TaxID=1839936 RepID=A0A7C1B8B0_9EURY|nr:NAD(P)/FAD-dependent oxidoreductase [Candidatus Syntrophoarchaeum butanivorans]
MRVIVIGAGPAGRFSATALKAMGGEPVVIEKDFLGGECANKRCIVEVSLAEYAVTLDVTEKMGLEPNAASFREVMGELRSFREMMRAFFDMQAKESGMEEIRGEAKLIDPKTVEVNGEMVKGDAIIIATGSRPLVPDIPGMDLDGVITYHDIIEMTELPEELVVVGGGAVGAAYACILGQLGSKVTVLERFKVLGEFDHDLRDYAIEQLKSRGISIFEGALVKEIKGGSRVESLLAEVDGEEREFSADCVLFATGLIPNSEIAKDIGVKIGERNEIIVNERMQTNVDGVYAAGDVIGPPFLTPVARREGWVAASNIMGKDVRMDYSLIPHFVPLFMEFSSVGLTEEEAVAEYGRENIAVLMMPPAVPYPSGCRSIWLARLDPRLTGMMKLVIERKSRKILGAHMASYTGKNAMHYLAALMKRGFTIDELAEIIEVYPDNDLFPVMAKMMLGMV